MSITEQMGVKESTIEEMQALIDEGDLSLGERRRVFRDMEGRDTNLSDDELLIAVAATEDDDDELFAENVKKVEQFKQLERVKAAEEDS